MCRQWSGRFGFLLEGGTEGFEAVVALARGVQRLVGLAVVAVLAVLAV